MNDRAPNRWLLQRFCLDWVLLAGMLTVVPSMAWADEKPETQAKLVELLESIPAQSGFAFCELTEQGPQMVYGEQENQPFAVGSSFKLFILGRLAGEVNQHQRRLDNLMHLNAKLTGPPHSEMASWPVGSPVTLQTLALKMISISDNTATDHLLHCLGRKNVEQQMAQMGHKQPELNRPLLFTREMVMLRDKRITDRRSQWKKLDEAGRRDFLNKEIKDLHDYEPVDFDTTAYDVAEWYASPMDLARVLDWLRNHTRETDPAHPLRGVISVATQIKFDSELWPYVGYKGGSEEQLLAGNWLLRHRDGRWFTLNIALNKQDGPLSQKDVSEVFTKMVSVIGASLSGD